MHGDEPAICAVELRAVLFAHALEHLPRLSRPGRPYLGKLSRFAETLKRPKRALIVDIPIEMDDGGVRHFEGYRAQHNLSRGPGKGGVRYHPEVTPEEVMALSAWMTIKTAAMCLPFGGAKGSFSKEPTVQPRPKQTTCCTTAAC